MTDKPLVDCCSSPGLLPFEQAMANMLALITPVTDIENIAITETLNRVLAEDVVSPVNVPPHHNSAMDGYAVAATSLTEQNLTLNLVGRSMAGAPFTGVCQQGQCIRIMTGAKMPKGCDSVEMQENCQVDGEKITFAQIKKYGAHVRNAGEDIAIGQPVFSKGHRITAVDLGMLASLGIENIKVVRKLKVALISTGDELKAPGQVLNEGDIYESNAHFISGLLTKLNIEIIDFGIINDDKSAIENAFKQADELADAVISSGGVSVGDADYTKEVLASLGQIDFWKIAMKPGKPFAFGKLPNSVFFGLPGNPVSALVTAHQLALPALVKMQNAQAIKRVTIKVKSANDLKKSAGRIDFQRGVLTVNEQGETVVNSTGSQGSGILSSIAKANCYIVLAACQGKVAAGEMVTVELFDQYLQ
ncbi:MAG: molybdopterin molybdenumtransferase MoeA [Gammaproteobacteria bacterium]|nr:MAG: molybdopterin molybdenumtransferase MoeA [Gammaproteobacteria bacterium]